MELNNAVCIVTGSATGIGAACVHRLGERGCRVVINYTKSEAEAKATLPNAKKFGVEALLVQANVAVDADCHRMAEAALEKVGPHRWARQQCRHNQSRIQSRGLECASTRRTSTTSTR